MRDEPKVPFVPPLPEQVQAYIEELIYSGHFQPGEKINEAELASNLGLSRSPVREALQRLAIEGLVTLRSHRGPFVTTFSRKTLTEVFEVREAVDGMAARLAAKRNDRVAIGEIEAYLKRAGKAIASNPASGYPKLPDFHELVHLAADNARLASIGRQLASQLRLARVLSGGKHERAENALSEHWQVFEAISSGDASKAEDVMRLHIRTSLHLAITFFEPANERTMDE